jgi:hypothetical protein
LDTKTQKSSQNAVSFAFSFFLRENLELYIPTSDQHSRKSFFLHTPLLSLTGSKDSVIVLLLLLLLHPILSSLSDTFKTAGT